MTIPMLSGWADSLKDLPTLGNNLAHILNPQMDVQRQLQMAVAQNPEIAQHLANLEAQNPGIIGKMFGQNNNGINSIAGMSPDIGTQIDMATQPQLKTALANPENLQEIVQKRAGFDSPEQRIIEKNRATSSGQQVQLGGQEIQLNQGALEDRARQTATENVAKAAMSRVKFNPATFDKDYTPEEQAALFGSKQYGPLINRQLMQYAQNQDKLFQLQMHREDRADARQAAADNFVRNRRLMFGQQLFEKSNGAITPTDAITLSDPQGQAQAAQLAADPNNKSSLAQGYRWLQEQRQAALEAIGNRKTRAQQRQTQLQLQITDGVTKALNTANDMLQPGKYKKPADPALVNQVLQNASSAAAMMGRNLTYQYVPEDTGNGFNPFDNKDAKIVVIDHDNGGRVYDADQNGVALAITPQVATRTPPMTAASGPATTAAPPPATGAVSPQKVLSPAAQKAQQILAGDPSKKQTIIEHYPEVAKELGLIQ